MITAGMTCKVWRETTSSPHGAIDANQSGFLHMSALRHQQWEHGQQESQSVRGQQVPAPTFYKLQLVFSTQCNI